MFSPTEISSSGRADTPGNNSLLRVFNEPDPARRAAVIAETYPEDVVWHEPDRVIHASGVDIARTKDGVVIELYTIIPEIHEYPTRATNPTASARRTSR